MAHRTPRVDLSGRTLLLGDHRHPDATGTADATGGRAGGAADPDAGIDVVIVDLSGLEPHAVAALVREAEAEIGGGSGAGTGVGTGGHAVGASGGTPPAVGAALAAGVGLVVLDVDAATPAEVRAVAEAGVVLVLRADDPAVAVAAVDGLTAAGVDTARVVVEVGPAFDVVGQVEVLDRAAYGFRVGAALRPPADHPDEARVGWEIGALTGLLPLGLATVRHADPRRFHRVRAVLDALHDAAIPADGLLSTADPGPAPDTDADPGPGPERAP